MDKVGIKTSNKVTVVIKLRNKIKDNIFATFTLSGQKELKENR